MVCVPLPVKLIRQKQGQPLRCYGIDGCFKYKLVNLRKTLAASHGSDLSAVEDGESLFPLEIEPLPFLNKPGADKGPDVCSEERHYTAGSKAQSQKIAVITSVRSCWQTDHNMSDGLAFVCIHTVVASSCRVRETSSACSERCGGRSLWA
jgi:hypothetical protein